MMKSNKKENDKSIDFEMKHLKEHLNSSFDFNNITMSADLINKTLKAINTGESPKVVSVDNNFKETNSKSTEYSKKKNKFPIYKFAGAVAAVVILVIGFNKIQDNLFMGKKDSSTSNSAMDIAMEKSIADSAEVEDKDVNAASIAETEGSTAAQSSEAAENKEASIEINENSDMKENRVTKDTSDETLAKSKEEKSTVNEETVTENEVVLDTTSETQAMVGITSDSDAVMDNPINYSLNSSISAKASDNKSFAENSTNYPIKVADYLILDDIYQISFFDQYAKDNIDGTNQNRSTNNPDVIKEFYQLLNECTFTESDAISGNLYYQIVILTKSKDQSYIINIKDGIQLIYQDKLHSENDFQLNLEGSTDKIKNWLVNYLV